MAIPVRAMSDEISRGTKHYELQERTEQTNEQAAEPLSEEAASARSDAGVQYVHLQLRRRMEPHL